MYIHQEQKSQLLKVRCIKAALGGKKMQICGEKKKSIVADLPMYQSIFASKLKEGFVW